MRRLTFDRLTRLCVLTCVLTGALATVTPAVASAQAAAEKKASPPAPGPAKSFALPTPQRFTLENGLKVTMVPFGKVPKVRIQVVVQAGNVYESAQQVWLADLTGDLMREGTSALTADALSRELAMMGGELQVSVGPELTTVATEVLAEQGPKALRLLADVLRTPRLPESDLERVKATLLRNLSIQRSTPGAMADEKFAAILYGDHPFGHIFPTEAMLRGYTLDDVRKFHREHFGAKRARVYVAGLFDAAAMEKAARETLGDWAGPEPQVVPPPPVRERGFALIDRPGAPQSTLRVGLRVTDPSTPAWTTLLVTNSLLGGSFASRITTNIREQKGYTYSPFSSVTPRTKLAAWTEQADVTTATTGAALKEIFAEIERLRREPPAVDELRGIQNNEAGRFVLQNSSRAGLIAGLSFVDSHGLGDDYLTRYVERVMAVTPDAVRQLASEQLVPDRMSLVVVGDPALVKDQLTTWSGATPDRK